LEGATVRHHTAQQSPAARGANAIDRYSLALQLIQVYPVILGGVAVVLPYRWLRILVALIGLVFWTVWAIIREKAAGSGRPDGRDTVALPDPTATTATVPAIRIDIWLHSDNAPS
jgi:hypothetical protein